MLRTLTRVAPRYIRPTFSIRCYSNELKPGSIPLSHSSSPIVKYTDNHEWVAAHSDNLAFVGITQYASDALGDAAYIGVTDPPADVEVSESIGVLESVKAASDVYSPVSGKLIERNEEVIANPALLTEDPVGNAWLAKIEMSDPSELDNLLTLEQYLDNLEDH